MQRLADSESPQQGKKGLNLAALDEYEESSSASKEEYEQEEELSISSSESEDVYSPEKKSPAKMGLKWYIQKHSDAFRQMEKDRRSYNVHFASKMASFRKVINQTIERSLL